MYYAQILNGIVIGVSQLNSKVDSPNLIKIATYDTSLIGKKWDGANFI
jgi:hypothetical protein